MASIQKNMRKRATFWPRELSFFLSLSRQIMQGLNLDRVLREVVEKAPLLLKADGLYYLSSQQKGKYAADGP